MKKLINVAILTLVAFFPRLPLKNGMDVKRKTLFSLLVI